MKKYSVISLSERKNTLLIIANSYENPINDLLSENYVPFLDNGDIVFDLAIINGLNANRFVGATINRHRLLPESIHIIYDVSPEILNSSKQFFMNNIDIVGKSSLPSAAKHILTN